MKDKNIHKGSGTSFTDQNQDKALKIKNVLDKQDQMYTRGESFPN